MVNHINYITQLLQARPSEVLIKMKSYTQLWGMLTYNFVEYKLSFIKSVLKITDTRLLFIAQMHLNSSGEARSFDLYMLFPFRQVPRVCSSPGSWPRSASHTLSKISNQICLGCDSESSLGKPQLSAMPAILPHPYLILQPVEDNLWTIFPKSPKKYGTAERHWRCRLFFLEGNENLTAFCCILSSGLANY